MELSQRAGCIGVAFTGQIPFTITEVSAWAGSPPCRHRIPRLSPAIRYLFIICRGPATDNPDAIRTSDFNGRNEIHNIKILSRHIPDMETVIFLLR